MTSNLARAARALGAVAILSSVLVLQPLPADAQVTGGCRATVNGVDADLARSASSAISVADGETIKVSGVAPGPITGYQIYLTFGPFRFQVAEGEVTGGSTTYSTEVEVSDYARYGVGIYQVDGTTSGTPCSAWAYVKVTGRSPFTTVAGIVGTAMVVAGAVGMGSSIPRRKA